MKSAKKRLTAALLCLFLLLFLICSCQNTPGLPEGSATGTAASTAEPLPTIRVYTLNVGKADCILIRTPKHLVVIDAGETDTEDQVLDCIKGTGTKTIDYLILTHFDNDHIGGADKILKKMNVKQVLEPDYERDSKKKEDLDRALEKAGITPTKVHEQFSFTLDGAEFTVYPPIKTDYPESDERDNLMSLAISVTYGETSFLFAGDCVGERLSELTQQLPDQTVSFLKVPHHGNFDDYFSYAFLAKLRPAYAAITCSGTTRPDQALLKCLDNLGCRTFLTFSGIVTASTDGVSVTVTQ